MRIAYLGNIAQNAYLLAKGLRALGVEADSFDQQGVGFPMQHPAWEDGDFDFAAQGLTVDQPFWDWTSLEITNGFRRPPWAKILGNDGRGVRPWYDTQKDFERDGLAVVRGQPVLRPRAIQRHDLYAALQDSATPAAAWEDVITTAEKVPDWRAMRAIVTDGGYDLAVLCGTYAAVGPLLPRAIPYIAFEHATMRYVPSLATGDHRLLALSYQQSAANVITNADCWEAAGMLGVRDRSTFIPHPLDEEKFCPGEAPTLRAKLQERLDCELLFLAPARHSRNEAVGSKRNDRILYAFKRYVDEAEPQGSPRAGLVLFAWGARKDIDE
ncbi:MAG TPA: hypothetical protein VNM48_07940, partial [Chloroflexota bacterium]|nr:hypothetical protein [Chloroflexota bacterium]